MTIGTIESTITDHEAAQIKRANATSATPVVFVHGLWLLPSSWDRWVTLFEEAGYVGLTPGWPDDPETVAAAAFTPVAFEPPESERIGADPPGCHREAERRRSL